MRLFTESLFLSNKGMYKVVQVIYEVLVTRMPDVEVPNSEIFTKEIKRQLASPDQKLLFLPVPIEYEIKC